MVDRVKALKLEDAASGGTQTDAFPTALNRNEDFLDSRGLAIQGPGSNDEAALISRDLDSGGSLTFKDQLITVTQSLRAVSSPDFSGTVRTVHGTDTRADHVTIAAAITASSSGDIILIGTGDYPEQITIDKNLALIGAAHNQGIDDPPRTRINPTISAAGAAITRAAGADSIVIRNLDIDFTWTGATGKVRGIDGSGGSRWLVEDVFIRGSTSTGAGAATNMLGMELQGGSVARNVKIQLQDSGNLIAATNAIEWSGTTGIRDMINCDILDGTNAPGNVKIVDAATVVRYRGCIIENKSENGVGGTVKEVTGNEIKDRVGPHTDVSKGGGEKSKTFGIESPTASEDLPPWFTNKAITITEIRAVVKGSSPSVTWTIRHDTDRSATGTEVVTGGTTTTDQATGSDVTTFNAAAVPKDAFVWVETTAQSGTVDWISIIIFYKED